MQLEFHGMKDDIMENKSIVDDKTLGVLESSDNPFLGRRSQKIFRAMRRPKRRDIDEETMKNRSQKFGTLQNKIRIMVEILKKRKELILPTCC